VRKSQNQYLRANLAWNIISREMALAGDEGGGNEELSSNMFKGPDFKTSTRIF